MLGQPIKTMNHAHDWCLVKKNMIYITPKNPGDQAVHPWKMVGNMSVKCLSNLIKKGRLFEFSAMRDKGGRIIREPGGDV